LYNVITFNIISFCPAQSFSASPPGPLVSTSPHKELQPVCGYSWRGYPLPVVVIKSGQHVPEANYSSQPHSTRRIDGRAYGLRRQTHGHVLRTQTWMQIVSEGLPTTSLQLAKYSTPTTNKGVYNSHVHIVSTSYL